MSDSQGLTIGNIADDITGSFSDLSKLLTSSSYLAGLGFSVASIAKFKAHKGNPAQAPVGTPTALLAVAAIQTYLPSLEAQAAAAGVTASEVKAAAAQAGITQAEVEAQASAAGFTSAEISAAESALKAKQSK
jgi:intracellular multiplication protein IcmD